MCDKAQPRQHGGAPGTHIPMQPLLAVWPLLAKPRAATATQPQWLLRGGNAVILHALHARQQSKGGPLHGCSVQQARAHEAGAQAWRPGAQQGSRRGKGET